MIANLADFLRESFDFTNAQELVPLSKELELVNAYLEIEKARYKERLKVIYNFEAAEDVMLPPITLQALVENAVKHGIGYRIRGGAIQIGGYRSGSEYVIYVEDDGQGISEEQMQFLFDERRKNAGIGLRNVEKRLHQCFDHGLTIKSKPSEGTRVKMRIPINGLK